MEPTNDVEATSDDDSVMSRGIQDPLLAKTYLGLPPIP